MKRNMIQNDIDYEKIAKKKILVIQELSRGRKIWIYGAGHFGIILYRIFDGCGIMVTGFVDSSVSSIEGMKNVPVKKLSDMDPSRDYLVVSISWIDYFLMRDLDAVGYSHEDYYYLLAGEMFHTEDIIYHGIQIGRYTYGYEQFLQEAVCIASIGRYCSINSTARLHVNHLVEACSTHLIMFNANAVPWEHQKERNCYVAQYKREHPKENRGLATIGNDVWIGANTVVLQGVTIGNGAIIGANSLVNHDVEPYSIVAGSPASQIRYRFTKEIRTKMEQIGWWNWEHEYIEENIAWFYEPEKFVKHFC